MSSAILVTKYWDNCADCPCCVFTDYAMHCQAVDDTGKTEICTREEYFSHEKYDLFDGVKIGEPKAPRPDWCPLIEVGEAMYYPKVR